MESIPASTDVAVVGRTAPGRARSRPDQFVRRLLRIDEPSPRVSAQAAHTAFQRSMLISGLRCTLTYVVFPLLLPLAGIATGVGPWVGLCIGVVAMVCDVFTIRRFFAADHRWRWQFSALILAVVVLLAVLLVQDFSRVA